LSLCTSCITLYWYRMCTEIYRRKWSCKHFNISSCKVLILVKSLKVAQKLVKNEKVASKVARTEKSCSKHKSCSKVAEHNRAMPTVDSTLWFHGWQLTVPVSLNVWYSSYSYLLLCMWAISNVYTCRHIREMPNFYFGSFLGSKHFSHMRSRQSRL
jgi:hypothetical protein